MLVQLSDYAFVDPWEVTSVILNGQGQIEFQIRGGGSIGAGVDADQAVVALKAFVELINRGRELSRRTPQTVTQTFQVGEDTDKRMAGQDGSLASDATLRRVEEAIEGAVRATPTPDS